MLRKLFIILIVLVTLGWVSYRSLQSYLSKKIIAALGEEAQKSGYSFAAKGGRVYPIGMYFEGISFIPPPSKFPAALAIERLEVSSPLEPLIRKVPQLTFNALLYGGILEGTFGLSGDYQKVSLSGSATDLNLALHPYLGILGIEAAKLSLHTPGIELTTGNSARGNLKIEITDFRKPSPTLLPEGIRLPGVNSLKGRALITLTQNHYEISDVSIESDLGTLSASFLRVDLTTPRERSPLSGTLLVDLSAKGDQEFESWLKMLFPNQPYSSSFSLEFGGTAGRPNIKMTAR